MTPEEVGNWIQFALFLVVVAGGFYWQGQQSQKIADLERARAEDKEIAAETKRQDDKLLEQTWAQHRENIEEAKRMARAAQEAAGKVEGLGAEIKHLATGVTAQLQHLAELFGERTQNINSRLDQFAHEQKNMGMKIDQVGRRTRPPRPPKEAPR